MLKFLRHEFNGRSALYQMLLCYKYNPINKQDITQKLSTCNMCQHYFHYDVCNDFLKQYSVGYNILRSLTVKSSQEVAVIDQQIETSGGKRYIETESMIHHKVLEESNVYANTIIKEDIYFTQRYRLSHEEFQDLVSKTNWSNESPYQIATGFVSFGIYSASNLKLTIDDERFDELTTNFVNKCSEFTDEQLIDCMVAVKIWPQSIHVKEKNFLKIWKALDYVCLERYLDWTVDKTLYMMDLWYHMHLIRLSNFVYKGLNKLSRKCKDLTRAQMTQIMFYMSCTRKLHPQISMRHYEYYLQKHITHMTIGEIGIFTLACFKTQTTILNEKLLLYIMQRVIKEIKTIPEPTLTAICKALRFSQRPELAFTMNDMVKKIEEERMSSLKLLSCIHVSLISTRLQFFNGELLTKLGESFCLDPSEARLKDMERVAFLLSQFNYIPQTTPDILDIILQQLELNKHLEAGENHPLIYVSLIYFLTLLQRFPDKHIRHLLSQEFLNKHFENKFLIPVQLLQIDYNRVLEGPQGSEHLLSPSLREFLSRKNSIYLPDVQYKKLSNFDTMLQEVLNISKDVLGGEEYYLTAYTLPHFPRADILFRLDSDGRPIAIPEELRKPKPFQDVLRPTGDGWRCVVVANRNMYMFNVPRLVGEANTKLRQLRLLGYTPIVIPFHFWMSEKDKVEYLKLKYFTTPG